MSKFTCLHFLVLVLYKHISMHTWQYILAYTLSIHLCTLSFPDRLFLVYVFLVNTFFMASFPPLYYEGDFLVLKKLYCKFVLSFSQFSKILC